jgi:hypothetical protein
MASNIDMRTWALVFAAGWLATAAGAQPWSGIRNPPGVDVSLRLPDPHPYRQGEVIRAQMKLPGWTPGQPPPAEQWQFVGLLLDPAVGCGSVAKPCFLDGGGNRAISRIINGPGGQPEHSFLNQWLPRLPPGHYRAAVLVRKLVLTNRGPMSSSYGYAEPPQYAVSGAVEFEIVAATPEWIRQTIAASVATLKTHPASREGYEAYERAAEQLSDLDEPEAWQASLALLPEEPRPFQGLQNTRRPERVCELLQGRVAAPAQAVPSVYLWTLQNVCVRAHLPPPPVPKGPARQLVARIAATPPAAAPAQPIDPAMEAYLKKLQAYQSELWEKATATLAASLPQKQAEAKTAAFTALLEYVQQHHNPAPPWVPALTREFVAWWPSVDVPSRRPLLDLFANTIRSPEVEPLLESVLDRWKPGDYYEAVHSAISELDQIDPRKAQARILAELVKPKTWVDEQQLELLPASAVPPMDDALIDALAADQRPGNWNPRLRMAAIAKYATPRAEPRIKAIYESQQDPCQPELMAYFVRVDPAYADRVFHSHPWDMHAPPPRCTVQYFLRTPPLAMGAPLEKYLEAYLMHGDVYIKTTAAHQLGLYGSPSAVSSLWDALRYFHDWWKGKGPELEQNGEGVRLEVELRNAIARGSNWLATPTDLRTIESLCISRQCLGETQQDLAAWQQPLRIDFAGPSGGWRGRVAQYSWFTSPAQLEAKLAQFPRGTRFVLLAADSADPAAVERLREFAAGRGLVLSNLH